MCVDNKNTDRMNNISTWSDFSKLDLFWKAWIEVPENIQRALDDIPAFPVSGKSWRDVAVKERIRAEFSHNLERRKTARFSPVTGK